jgi:hypothetical protein
MSPRESVGQAATGKAAAGAEAWARGGLSDRTTDPSARLTHSLAEAPSR